MVEAGLMVIELEHSSNSGCTHPSCHHQRHKSVSSSLTSLWKQRQRLVALVPSVWRIHRGLHPTASHQRERLQYFELWTTSVHSGVDQLLVRLPHATPRSRNRRQLIVRLDKLQCQQLHIINRTKGHGGSASLCYLITAKRHQFEEILMLQHGIKI